MFQNGGTTSFAARNFLDSYLAEFVRQSKLSENDPNVKTFYRIFQNFGFRYDTTLYRNNKLGTFKKNI